MRIGDWSSGVCSSDLDAPFGDGQYLLERLLAALGHEAGEARVDVLDARLCQRVELVVHAAEDIGLPRQRRRRDAVGVDADLGERLVEARQDAEYTDRSDRKSVV